MRNKDCGTKECKINVCALILCFEFYVRRFLSHDSFSQPFMSMAMFHLVFCKNLERLAFLKKSFVLQVLKKMFITVALLFLSRLDFTAAEL